MNEINYKQERENDFNTILNSPYPRKVVVGSPGTGKTYLFKEMIKRKKREGKTNFLAITFIGKLADALADDLAGLAETMTLHGFARKFVLDKCPEGWEYYPKISKIIKEDLKIKGVTEFKTGDTNYDERTKYYKAIGDDDVMHYAVQICKKDNEKIPKYDLVLIDEFQDFNEVEAEFINLLATKNEILIVGDDDQALYEFKGSFSKFIREKFDKSNTDFENHILRFCSRCTEVIINAFHNIVEYFEDKGKINNRIKKDYICYLPEKKGDNDLNQKILVFENIAPGAIPVKIKDELKKILEGQKIKSVLVIGEARTCKTLLSSIAKKLREIGFKNISYTKSNQDKVFSFKPHVVNGYKILAKGKNAVLAWRLLIEELQDENKTKEIILNHYNDADSFIKALPCEFKKAQEENAKILAAILRKTKSERTQITNSSVEKLRAQIKIEKKEDREIFINQLIDESKSLPRPLANLDITVCSILGAKGLGADVVFLVGFDQGKLPFKEDITESEIYQFLVALTRAKKCLYVINTIGKQTSQFIDILDKEFYAKP